MGLESMNIFANLRVYAGKWQVKESRAFLPEEKAAVLQAVVVPSQYGNSVQFTMQGGGLTYIPLSVRLWTLIRHSSSHSVRVVRQTSTE